MCWRLILHNISRDSIRPIPNSFQVALKILGGHELVLFVSTCFPPLLFWFVTVMSLSHADTQGYYTAANVSKPTTKHQEKQYSLQDACVSLMPLQPGVFFHLIQLPVDLLYPSLFSLSHIVTCPPTCVSSCGL